VEEEGDEEDIRKLKALCFHYFFNINSKKKFDKKEIKLEYIKYNFFFQLKSTNQTRTTFK
jgi:hypothetical protein